MTNILLTNIPSGANPTDFPPIGISNVIENINPALNCNTSFLDLDYYRPSFEKIKEKIRGFSPQIIGFSAILTPAYSYLKELSAFIKDHFPDIIQVLGGEMAVISNIILQKTRIDFLTRKQNNGQYNRCYCCRCSNYTQKDIPHFIIKGFAIIHFWLVVTCRI